MNGVTRWLLNVSVLVFPVSSMLSVGLGHRMNQVFGPLREMHRFVRALVANFLLVPLLAWSVAHLLSIDRPFEVGLILISTAAGAPFLIKLTQAAGGDVALSAALLMILLPATVLFMPFIVPLIEPEARVGPGAIAAPLALTLILPLGVGLWVRARRARFALRMQPLMARLSSIALVVLLASTLIVHFGGIVGIFGSGAILATLLVVGGAFLIGYLLSSASRDARTTLGLGTAQRNIAAAMVVATQSLHDPDTLVMVVVASIIDLLVLFPIAWALRRRTPRQRRVEAMA